MLATTKQLNEVMSTAEILGDFERKSPQDFSNENPTSAYGF